MFKKHSLIKKIAFGAAALALGVTLGACSNKSNTKSGSSDSSSEKTIAFIPPSMVSPFYKGTLDGAKAEAKKLGYKLDALAPQKEDDFEGLLKIVEDTISKKPAAVAICTTDDKTMIAALKKLNAAKIPAIVFNTQSTFKGTDVYSAVGYDQQKAGVNAAKYLGTKYKSRDLYVGILEGLPGVFTENREGGFVKEAKKYSNIHIVSKQPADWDRGKALDVATNMYQANKKINTFYGLSDEMALGAAAAARQTGIKDAITIGIDGNPNTLNAIKKGQATATVYTNPKLMGERTIKDADAAIKGKKKSNPMNEVPTIVVDKSKVNEYIN